MEPQDQEDSLGRDYAKERYLSATASASQANYHNFGNIRRGFHNPSHLDRNHYSYPPPYQEIPRANGLQNLGTSSPFDPFLTRDYRHLRNSLSALGGAHDTITHDNVLEPSDCLMTTPEGSRNPSFAGQNGAQTLPIPAFGTPSVPINLFPHQGRLPSVSYVLNPEPASYGHPSTGPATNNHPSAVTNQQIPNSLAPSTSQVLAPLSEISAETARPPFSIREQRYFHYITLYNACLDASASHLASLRRRHRISSRRYRPYAPPPPYRSHLAPGRPTSLMDNISVICTHMWRRARNDGVAPHRAEAGAVRVMRDLYAWGEVVVRGLEEEGFVAPEDVDMESQSGGGNLGEGEALKVGEAAKNLCRLLKDRRAWSLCDDVVKELRDLEDVEFRRGGGGDMLSEGAGGII